MNNKLQAIVLHQIKYKDNCSIIYLYTNKLGRKTYMLRTGSKKNKFPLQTLNIINFESYGKQMSEMQHIKEWSQYSLFPNITTDITKSAIALFIGELLYKLLKEEEMNIDLFNFLNKSIHMLDNLDEGVSNFHLFFMIQLSRFLGFSIPNNYRNLDYFDIKNSEFTSLKPKHPLFFDIKETQILTTFLNSSSDFINIKLNGELRYTFSNKMIDFYAFHFDHILPIRSLSVLHEVFS